MVGHLETSISEIACLEVYFHLIIMYLIEVAYRVRKDEWASCYLPSMTHVLIQIDRLRKGEITHYLL